MKVAVFGMGYVGSVTSACLAANGHDVWGVDVDPVKVVPIAAGRSPVIEPGLDELIGNAVAAGTLHATTDTGRALDRAEISIVCVGTPSDATGGADLTHLRSAVSDIARTLGSVTPPESGRHTVVVRSTVPPGSVEQVVIPVLAEMHTGSALAVSAAMCPEFLREGSGIADFFAPPLLVVGTDDEQAGDSMRELFGFLERDIRLVDLRTAEALKYACNAFHATKVSFANEIGRVFRHFGVDARTVMDLFSQDTILNISPAYLQPGFAFGGSCLPKDLRSILHLARHNGIDLPLLDGTLASNELVISGVVDRVLAEEGRDIALLGLSFKSATDDLRESPSVELAERLIGKGYNLRIYDAIVNPSRLVGANRRHVESKLPHLRRVLADDPSAALRGAQIALVSTTDPATVEALLANPPRRIFDLNGRLGTRVEALPGYQGVGW